MGTDPRRRCGTAWREEGRREGEEEGRGHGGMEGRRHGEKEKRRNSFFDLSPDGDGVPSASCSWSSWATRGHLVTQLCSSCSSSNRRFNLMLLHKGLDFWVWTSGSGWVWVGQGVLDQSRTSHGHQHKRINVTLCSLLAWRRFK